MTSLSPLRFQPIFRRYLWGGRRLGSLLNKPIGEGADYAESWEIVDRGEDQSIVSHGPLAGKSLGELVRSQGEALLGRHHPQARFPLLFKLLDAHAQLSVQVHPNDEQAAKLAAPDFGKTEAWVILAAEPGSYIYAGLKRGFDRHALAREIARGTCELCLHRLEPQVGDCIFLPAGTIHALGPGLLVAEIQQSSDTTYRVYDWNRVGPDGKTRELHVKQALEVIDFDFGPVAPQQPRVIESQFENRRGLSPFAVPGEQKGSDPLPADGSRIERLVECDKFVLDRLRIAAPQTLGGDNRCHLLCVTEGSVQVADDPTGRPLEVGETILLPAACGPVPITPLQNACLLDASLP